jgi:hypothetical protein
MPCRPSKITMDDDKRFEMYRLNVMLSMPDSDVRDARLRAIRHKLKRLEAEGHGESERPTSPGVNWGRLKSSHPRDV